MQSVGAACDLLALAFDPAEASSSHKRDDILMNVRPRKSAEAFRHAADAVGVEDEEGEFEFSEEMLEMEPIEFYV